VKAPITRAEVETLVEFATRHTVTEAKAAFPAFADDAVEHLYELTEQQRLLLFHHLALRRTKPEQTAAIRKPARGSTDTSGPSSSWDMIVKLYEDA
jgi:hypothetical protein